MLKSFQDLNEDLYFPSLFRFVMFPNECKVELVSVQVGKALTK